MGEKTGIEWTDTTWNPIRGCRRVNSECLFCYAEVVATRYSGPGGAYEGLVDGKGRWNGQFAVIPHKLLEPLRWRRKPRLIFVNSMSDMFFEPIDFETIAGLLGIMVYAHWHQFQILTKRAKRMYAFFAWLRSEAPAALQRHVELVAAAERKCGEPVGHRGAGKASGEVLRLLEAAAALLARHGVENRLPTGAYTDRWPIPNVWFGVSAGTQESLNDNLPPLLAIPAAIRWVSAEPLLAPLDFSEVPWFDQYRQEYGLELGVGAGFLDVLERKFRAGTGSPAADRREDAIWNPWNPPTGLDWVVVGGESGTDRKIRPMSPEWARGIRDQCERAKVPFLFKQWGEFEELEGRSPRIGDVWALGTGHSQNWTPDSVGEAAGRWGPYRDVLMMRVGKKEDGETRRTLDGRLHDGYPAPAYELTR